MSCCAVYKLKKQEIQKHNSVQILRPETQELMVELPVRGQNPENHGWLAWVPASRSQRSRSTGVMSRRWMSHAKERQRELILHPTYCSLQVLYWFLMPVPAGENRSALVSLLIQALISSRNTLTDTPRDHIFLAIWLSLSPATQHGRYTVTAQRAPSPELSRQSRVLFLSLSAYTQPHPQIISRNWLSLSTSLF